MTYIDEGQAITLEQVLKIGLKYSRDRPSAVRTFAASRTHDDEVCNHTCPRCCTRSHSPHPSSRNSSRTNSRAGSPRPTRAFHTVHDGKYWANLGLDDIYHTYAELLSLKPMASARISQWHQPASFSKPTSTILPTKSQVMPLMQLPPSSPSRTPPTSPALPEAFHLSLFFSYPLPFLVLFFWGAYTDFLFGGLSIRWSSPFYWRS
jgi:hypothetical protein